MTARRKKMGLPLGYSVLLHGIILALFFVTISESPKTFKSEPEPETVAATVLDESKVQAEVERLKQKERDKLRAEDLRHKQAIQARQKEANRLAELKKQHVLEQQRANEQAEKRKRELDAEAERIALLQKQKAEEQDRLEEIKKQKQAAEKQRVEEEKRLADLEQKRKLELKKQQQEKRAREEAERKAAEQRLAAEKKRKAADAIERAAAANRAKREIANAKVLIQQKVNRSWLRPAATAQGLSCRIQVKLIPGGDVVEARVIRSSGNPAFDRSAEIAVRKASPLPLPTDPGLFSLFRNFDFEFRPDA